MGVVIFLFVANFCHFEGKKNLFEKEYSLHGFRNFLIKKEK